MLKKKNENMRLSVFALGYFFANINHELAESERNFIEEKVELLKEGKDSLKLRKKFINITNTNPDFPTICSQYLDHLSEEELQSLDHFILELVHSDQKVTNEERVFLNQDWLTYLGKRLGETYLYARASYHIRASDPSVSHPQASTPFVLGPALGASVDLLDTLFGDGSDRSLNKQDKLDDTEELQRLTGFTVAECDALINKTNWSPKEANENLKTLLNVSSSVAEKEAIASGIREAGLYNRLGENLSKLNTMRGGVNGFKGFLTEELQATEASIAGKSTTVLNNNGIADLEYIGKNGHRYYQQVKTGYKPGQIDFAKYKGQTIVVDKGNPYLKTFQAEARKHGIKVVEGDFTNQGAKDISNLMQAETHLTGSKTSSAVTSGIKAKGVVSASHKAGLSSAKTGAQFGGGFSLGTNLVDVLNGDKSVGEAADDVVVDTVVAGAVGYGVGAAATAVGSTTVGAAALSTAGTVGSTIAGTAVGGTVLGAGAATAATIGGAGAAATGTAIGAVGAVGSAIGSTAVAATAGTAIGGTVAAGVAGASAAGAAIGAAAVAAAPVVAVGAALGAAFKFLDWLCDD